PAGDQHRRRRDRPGVRRARIRAREPQGITSMRHLLHLFDLTGDEICRLLKEAARLKTARMRGIPSTTLQGKVVGLVFEKPSMRTRVSFEAGVAQLGGAALFMPGSEVGLGWRETLPDFARTMSRYVDAMVLRVYRQSTVEAI